MTVSAIAATDLNNLIGIGHEMPWHLPKDFKYFKNTTMGHPIIMGRKSFESIGCKPLKGRPHIIVSTDPELNYSGVDTVTTVEDAINLAKTFNSGNVFICGGGQIYKYALDNKLIDKLYITSIETKIHVDYDDWDNGRCVYFPKYSADNWDMVSAEKVEKDEKNMYDMNFLVFERNF